MFGRADPERATLATTFERLPGPMFAAIREHARARQLVLDPAGPAFLTRSLRRAGLLSRLTGTADPDDEDLTALVVGSRDVVVATLGARRGTAVLSARLSDVELASLAQRLEGTGPGGACDDGVAITGFATTVDGVAARGSFFVGLGPPEGPAARRTLEQAVRLARAA